MKLNVNLYSVFAILLFNLTIAQTTTIPDENFEQALIDMNIDSDGIINGQVLTADIENIVELDFSNLYFTVSYDEAITDFTGIENFESLEIINLSNLWVELLEDQADVFNSNLNLIEFIADDASVDSSPFLCLSKLDFSNLANLEIISLYNSCNLSVINLKNPSITRTNLTIDLSHEYWDPPNTYTVCINVSDAQAASSGQFPYNTWDIIAQIPDENSYAYLEYTFSSNCTLSTSDFDLKNSITIYPNPVKDKLWIKNPNQLQLKSVKVFTIQGKLVKSFANVEDGISIPELESGVYFVKINDTISFKILKE